MFKMSAFSKSFLNSALQQCFLVNSFIQEHYSICFSFPIRAGDCVVHVVFSLTIVIPFLTLV